eukprot:15365976-Ditylum_brightwellii.AAC.1
MNNVIIPIAATTLVSTITDELQNNKIKTIEKDVHSENKSDANDVTDNMDSTSTTTATTDSSLLNTPEVTKPKQSRLKVPLLLTIVLGVQRESKST